MVGNRQPGWYASGVVGTASVVPNSPSIIGQLASLSMEFGVRVYVGASSRSMVIGSFRGAIRLMSFIRVSSQRVVPWIVSENIAQFSALKRLANLSTFLVA